MLLFVNLTLVHSCKYPRVAMSIAQIYGNSIKRSESNYFKGNASMKADRFHWCISATKKIVFSGYFKMDWIGNKV